MINSLAENCLPLREARNVIPGRPSLETIHRWHLQGIRGPHGTRIKLATIKVAGKRFVTREAIAEFIAASNGKNMESIGGPSVSAAQIQQAGDALDMILGRNRSPACP